ncbi:MAG: DUF3857 domain-containing protein [Bacteroidetes bacterium]|nr:DUF3857 domain-containing protein [Bacteroidota bacterium]
MSKFLWTILVFLNFSPVLIIAGDPIYPAYLIPDSLKENANAVIRFSETNLQVSSGYKATYSVKNVITILNSRGDDYGIYIGYYDKQRKISHLSIRIYDQLGNLVDKVKNSDIEDYSAISGFSLYEDNRVRFYEPTVNRYPYTVIIEYSLNYNGYIQFPYWQPQPGSDVAIEHAILNLKMPSDHPIRYKTYHMKGKPTGRESGGSIDIHWILKQVKAFQPEPFQPLMNAVLPVVYLAPSNFSYDGSRGNMDNWENFGYWVYELLEGKTSLSESTRQKITDLVIDVPDTLEKVRRIYQYMQEYTRYVSIQLGIGDFQPFDAETVDRVGYGDCKALTNYTRALLESVGISSIYTIVKAGENWENIKTDFPSQQFNHVILAVPLHKDTIWLECTNQQMPFGFLGEFTDNRWALAITPMGGKLIKTRSYHTDSNQKICHGTIILDENGDGNGTLKFKYSGLQFDEVFGFVMADDKSQKKWLSQNLYIPNGKVTGYNVDHEGDMHPSANLEVQYDLEKYAVRSGKRLFITLNPLIGYPELPAREEKRKYDICLHKSYIHTDSIVYKLPDGFEAEHLPARVELSSAFGTFSTSVNIDDGRATYIRCLRINEGQYPASDYPDFYAFYKTVTRADKAKLVLTSGF